MESIDRTAPLTREQVTAAVGSVDEIVLAEIMDMGATAD